MYEAAEIDGATRWSKIRFITLPLLKSTVITLTLMSIGRIFYSDFGLFYQVPMNSGALINATNTIDTYVYRGLIELGRYQHVVCGMCISVTGGLCPGAGSQSDNQKNTVLRMHYFSRQEGQYGWEKERRYQWMLTLAMGLISLIMIIPLVLLVMASLTSNNEIIMHGYSFWPKQFSLEAISIYME